jgi:stage V sporulation protein S
MKTLKVSSQSKAYAVATSISEIIKEEGEVQVVSIGAASLNEATKAIIYAKGNLSTVGMSMYCIPSFVDVDIDDGTEIEKGRSIKDIIKTNIKIGHESLANEG